MPCSLNPAIFDPFSLDIWDPFEGFPISSTLANFSTTATRNTSAIANTHIDWKETLEAHVFKAYLSWTEEGKVKASMENGMLIVITPKEEEKKPEVKAIDISG
ncbi:hypothetical protein LguiB_013525 [Lonicera macranthoides]